MTSLSKRKGDGWERAVRDYFRGRGYPSERTYGAGRADDVGDLAIRAPIPLMVECKAAAKSERALWLRTLYAKAVLSTAAERPYGVLIERRRNSAVGLAFVTLDLATFVDLLDRLRDG